jgi:DNA adenine methylase
MATEVQLTPPDPHPFVKWAGGKSALVGEISQRIPQGRNYRRYIEPFVGAGALFFWVRRCMPSLACLIGDSNSELINAYRIIRDHVEELIAKLETHALMHSREHYYAVRKKVPPGLAERAARFIYLNRTCYNGLYRVNRRGEFNVPMGRYDHPRIVDRENLLAVSSALQGVDIRSADFEEMTEDCGADDLVYLDPPYYPLSETSHFTSYTREGFDVGEQRRLAQVFEHIARRGASVILSNSSSVLIRRMYTTLEPQPRIDEVEVARHINSKATNRGPVTELLISYPA